MLRRRKLSMFVRESGRWLACGTPAFCSAAAAGTASPSAAPIANIDKIRLRITPTFAEEMGSYITHIAEEYLNGRLAANSVLDLPPAFEERVAYRPQREIHQEQRATA